MASVQASILLIVDVTNPHAVTFTSAGGLSPVSTGTNYTFEDGIDLEGFFTTNLLGGSFLITPLVSPAATLTTGDASGGVIYANGYADNNSTSGGAHVDFNIYTEQGSSPTLMSFTTLSDAFNTGGSITFDLHGIPYLQAGSIGTLDAGYSGSVGGVTPIGEFEVIPEPSGFYGSAVCLLMILFLIYRQGRREPATVSA
jgi:hypothetical protein